MSPKVPAHILLKSSGVLAAEWAGGPAVHGEGLSRIRSFTQDTAVLFVFILWLMKRPQVLLISSQTTSRTGQGPSLSRLSQPQNWPGMNCKCSHFLSWLVKALFGKVHDFTAGAWDGKGHTEKRAAYREEAMMGKGAKDS